MTPRTNAVGVIVAAGTIAAAGWLASSLSGTPLVGYDDANIFFVYARNLLDGHGFVYYPAGERVEGFTSIAWVLICAAAMAVTTRFELLLFALNCLVLAATLWSLRGLVMQTLGRDSEAPAKAHAWALALIATVALTPGSIAWNVVSLMDAGLWASLLLLTAVTVLRSAVDSTATAKQPALPLLIVALTLTRPEALLWGPLFISLSIFVAVMRGDAVARAIRQHSASIVGFVTTVTALFAWRLAYFGYPLPNTFYAKAGDPLANRLAEGGWHLFDFAIANPVMPLAIVTAMWSTITSYRERRLFSASAAVLVMLLAGCAVPVFEGGDHFGLWRMFQPIVPLATVQAALAAVLISRREHRPRPATIAIGITIVLALVPWRHWAILDELSYAARTPSGASSTPQVEIAIAEDMRHLGAAFSRTFPAIKPRVGVIVAGGFAFAYDGPTIDLMGLNNVAMAHSPGPRYGMRSHAAFNQDVFFSLAPDVLLLSLWSPNRPDWFGFPMLSGVFPAPPSGRRDYFQRRALSMQAFDAGVLKGLLQNQRIAEYAWASVRQPGAGEWLHTVFKRDFLERLRTAGYEIVLPVPPPA